MKILDVEKIEKFKKDMNKMDKVVALPKEVSDHMQENYDLLKDNTFINLDLNHREYSFIKSMLANKLIDEEKNQLLEMVKNEETILIIETLLKKLLDDDESINWLKEQVIKQIKNKRQWEIDTENRHTLIEIPLKMEGDTK